MAGFTVKAYRGDAKTLLAFNLPDRKSAERLAGFTIQCQPDGQDPYFLQNNLRFETPGNHAQDPQEPANSSINAPIHKFRWLHVPGSVHQGLKPFFGKYIYTVTPRFFDDHKSLQPIDPARSVSVSVLVEPFKKKGLELGFTRGFTQSQAFVHHFGLKARIQPNPRGLQFDTSEVSGVNHNGEKFTFAQEYEWLGFTARERIFAILNEVTADKSLSLDVFAYDLNEPDVIGSLLALARQGRVRVILDNAALHHSKDNSKPEDAFETAFQKVANKDAKPGKKNAAILRAKFGRYAHDKIFIASNKDGATKVMTGSTNLSVTGVYVNSNHVLVFTDPKVTAKYAEVFGAVWNGAKTVGAFSKLDLAKKSFSFNTPSMEITFSPHDEEHATQILDGMVARIKAEGKKGKATGSVLFAVMETETGTGPVYPTLRDLHKRQEIFSYGISDTTSGIQLYTLGKASGVLVTGRPTNTKLPPPFDQVPGVGIGHQVHHKFVVCGFNGDDPVVYCGSSNLALGGEEENGDNLLAIRDRDVATAFAIEALGLVDHFDFLDRVSSKTPKKTKKLTTASKVQAAASAGWFLSITDKWVDPYFDPMDLKCMDRKLFGE
jgi:hypothetical protein